jgi:hypothetical protein
VSNEIKMADEAYTKVIELCANVVCSKIDEVGAENYISHSLETECGREVEVTVRYAGGKTPAEKLDVAQKRLAELESQLRAVVDNKELIVKFIKEDMEFIQRVSNIASDASQEYAKRVVLLKTIKGLANPEKEQGS